RPISFANSTSLPAALLAVLYNPSRTRFASIPSMSKTKPENQIDYVELPAKDIAQTKAFYSSAFGWKFEDYGPAYTSFFDGRLAGGFTTEGAPPARGALVVIYTSDLAALQKRIEA